MSTGPINDLIPVHCNNCGKKIAEVKIKEGIISIICPKCKTENIQETKSPERVKNTGG